MSKVIVDLEDPRIQILKATFPEAFSKDHFDKDILLEELGISENDQVEEKVEIDEPQESSLWLLPFLKRRLEQNRSANIVCTGDTGSGKSYSALSLGEEIDQGFTVERVVFTPLDFIRLVNSNLPKGSVVLFDDAGLGIPAREWADIGPKIFGKLYQGFRFKNLISIITVPDLDFIESQSRRLMHILLEATDTQGIMKPFRPYKPFRGSDKLGFKYPTMKKNGKEVKVKTAKFHLPSKELVQAYEDKKKEWMEKSFREFEEELDFQEKLKEHNAEERKKEMERWLTRDVKKQKKEAKRKQIVLLGESGLSVRQIAKEAKTSIATVSRVLSEVR